MSPQMWTGWGIRTLAVRRAGLRPDELPLRHGVAARLGVVRGGPARLRVHRRGVVGGARAAGGGVASGSGRLPELFAGLDRGDVETPVPFPTSCSPQAWAAATPFLLMRIMLGLEPSTRRGLHAQPDLRARSTATSSFNGVRRFDSKMGRRHRRRRDLRERVRGPPARVVAHASTPRRRKSQTNPPGNVEPKAHAPRPPLPDPFLSPSCPDVAGFR